MSFDLPSDWLQTKIHFSVVGIQQVMGGDAMRLHRFILLVQETMFRIIKWYVITISRKFGNWHIHNLYAQSEITESLKESEQAWMRLDLTFRVFKGRLSSFLQDVLKRDVLGKVVAQVHVLEFQKRGLPHDHILLSFQMKTNPGQRMIMTKSSEQKFQTLIRIHIYYY